MAMPQDPAHAAELLTLALAQPMPTDTRVAVLMALAQVHELAGDFIACARVADEALITCDPLRSERHRHRIVAQRAWAWALLDRTREAEEEALHLLRASEHRIEPARRATLHLLLGFVALHLGEVRRSYHSILTAWEATSGAASPMWRSVVQRSLADTLLDGEAWVAVPEAVAALDLNDTSLSRDSSLTAIRWRALLAQAAGDSEGAARMLERGREALRHTSDRIEIARYLHHLGIAELGSGPSRARAAIDALDQALARFGPEGTGYFRAESHLARARAALLIDAREAALRDLDEAVELARRLQCRRTLGSALRERAALHLRG